MQNLVDKMNSLVIKSMIKMNSFMQDENGDTNFISILVLLGIALALAGVFLVYKDRVIGWVDENTEKFFNMKGGR